MWCKDLHVILSGILSLISKVYVSIWITLFDFQTQWAGADHLLGQFFYISYNETDFDLFGKQYNYNGHSAGYVKVNLTRYAHPTSAFWNATVRKMYQNTSKYEFFAYVML